jgi:serine/threonine-protein kinase RsbT
VPTLVVKQQVLPLRSGEDVVRVRQSVRECTVSIGFSLVQQTKMVTAASELARNTLHHGHGGEMALEQVADGPRKGLRLIFTDQGPGIADIEMALKDGFTTGSGMGLGLGGAKRLVDHFEIDSAVGKGTRVSILRWT